MMNNNLMGLVQTMMGGGNPAGMIRQMAARDPRVAQAVQMLGGKSPQQLEQMVRNMCRERGTTPEDLARSMGFTIPNNR